MLYIFSRKIIIFLVLFLHFHGLNAQISAKDNKNFREFNKKDYYFGINLGINRANYKVYQSRNFINNDSINVSEGASDIGVNMHLITNIKIGEYFDFRFIPGFAYVNRGLEYTNRISESVVVRKIESVFVEMPFHLRYKSDPYKDKRLFVVAGLKYCYDVQTNSKSRRTQIKISPHEFQYEVGLGMQIFYPYFIFSPEIKFSRGLGNILIHNPSLIETKILENVVTQMFSISFNFEG